MEKFAFIFSIYIILLSIIPCASCTAHNEDMHAHETSTHSEKEHNDGQKSNDCSPFCTCEYCSSIIIIFSNLSIPKPKISNTDIHLSKYQFTYVFNYSKGVWHPPSKC